MAIKTGMLIAQKKLNIAKTICGVDLMCFSQGNGAKMTQIGIYLHISAFLLNP
jgi:hypothetical protein